MATKRKLRGKQKSLVQHLANLGADMRKFRRQYIDSDYFRGLQAGYLAASKHLAKYWDIHK